MRDASAWLASKLLLVLERYGLLNVWYRRPVTYLYLALLKSHIQQRFQGIIVQISTNVVQNVVQSLCIAEQKLGAGRDNRSHCRSGYLPDTLERFEKKHRRSNLNRGTT